MESKSRAVRANGVSKAVAIVVAGILCMLLMVATGCSSSAASSASSSASSSSSQATQSAQSSSSAAVSSSAASSSSQAQAQSSAAAASSSAATSANAASDIITSEQATTLALDKAGVDASAATMVKSTLDYENGVQVYEVSFMANGVEYDYEINAVTGEVVEYEIDVD